MGRCSVSFSVNCQYISELIGQATSLCALGSSYTKVKQHKTNYWIVVIYNDEGGDNKNNK